MSPEDRSKRDPLQSLIAEILDTENRGEAVDRDSLLAKHPEHADSLREFFASHDQMKSAADVDPPTLPPRSREPAREDPTIASGESPLDDPTLPPAKPNGDDPTLPPTQGTSTTEEPTVGDQIRYFGDYELLEEIARGGMGIVFKAKQTSLARVVALKMILAGELATDEQVARFRSEANAAAILDHPGIVPIYEIGEHKDRHFFSMGYVDGVSLADVIKEDGRLDSRRAAEIVAQIADAVAYAHRRGIIHRDLKPSNVLMDGAQPRVTDFGLAKRLEGGSELTRTGQIVGTPSYMPPEQAAGDLQAVGATADVYSLGAVLYALITGKPPFQAATPMETLLKVLDANPVPPKKENPKVPLALDTIVRKCMERSPGLRYASASELSDDLNRYLSGDPILASPYSKTQRFAKWSERHAGFSIVLTMLPLLLVGGYSSALFVGAVVLGHRLPKVQNSRALLGGALLVPLLTSIAFYFVFPRTPSLLLLSGLFVAFAILSITGSSTVLVYRSLGKGLRESANTRLSRRQYAKLQNVLAAGILTAVSIFFVVLFLDRFMPMGMFIPEIPVALQERMDDRHISEIVNKASVTAGRAIKYNILVAVLQPSIGIAAIIVGLAFGLLLKDFLSRGPGECGNDEHPERFTRIMICVLIGMVLQQLVSSPIVDKALFAWDISSYPRSADFFAGHDLLYPVLGCVGSVLGLAVGALLFELGLSRRKLLTGSGLIVFLIVTVDFWDGWSIRSAARRWQHNGHLFNGDGSKLATQPSIASMPSGSLVIDRSRGLFDAKGDVELRFESPLQVIRNDRFIRGIESDRMVIKLERNALWSQWKVHEIRVPGESSQFSPTYLLFFPTQVLAKKWEDSHLGNNVINPTPNDLRRSR